MILVTGGTGLIGSHLLFELVLHHDKIRAIKRIDSNILNVIKVFGYYADNAEVLFNKIDWIDTDLNDYLSLQEAFNDVEVVFHCAGLVSFDRRKKRDLFATNVMGTSNIVNICLEKKVKKLCFVSSIASFGEFDGKNPINETTRWKPGKKSSLYSLSKLKSEMEVWRGIAEGLNGVIVNPSVVIGPGFWNNGAGKIFRKVFQGLRFYTLGSTGYVDVRDVAKIMVQLVESDISGEQFLISSENFTFKEILEIIAEFLGCKKPNIYAGTLITGLGWRLEMLKSIITGRQPTITRDSAKIAHKYYLYSNKKIKEKLNYNFIPIKESIEFLSGKFLVEMKMK